MSNANRVKKKSLFLWKETTITQFAFWNHFRHILPEEIEIESHLQNIMISTLNAFLNVFYMDKSVTISEHYEFSARNNFWSQSDIWTDWFWNQPDQTKTDQTKNLF